MCPETLAAVRNGLAPIGDILLLQQSGERKLLGLEALLYMVEPLDEPSTLNKYFIPEVAKITM